MRCDVNLSIRPQGSQELGVRTEMKNMNSLSAIARAIDYEISRHIDAVENRTEIRVIITLLVKCSLPVNVAVQHHPGSHAKIDYTFVQDREHPWHPAASRAFFLYAPEGSIRRKKQRRIHTLPMTKASILRLPLLQGSRQ